METYYGTKRITAEPAPNAAGAAGYRVVYPDGYHSWSPQDVFEAAYRKSGEMNFGHALEALKEGLKVRRWEWAATAAEGYHIVLVSGAILESFIGLSDPRLAQEFSHEDILAEDWEIVQ